MKLTILASLQTLPLLVEGRVAIIDGNTYTLYKPAKGIEIKDNFDPIQYALLTESDKYHPCIVYAKKNLRHDFLVNRQLKRRCKVGDKIHLHSRRGIYQVVKITDEFIHITCNKWQYEESPVRVTGHENFAALAGGYHNRIYK